MGEDHPRPDLDRLTVAAAAEALGVSQDAVRKRIARGTIPQDRDASGRVYVYVSPSETVRKTDQDAVRGVASKTVLDSYIRSLEDQIAFLRGELERKDAILMNLTDRIPQLEAPQEEPPEPPETPSEPVRGTEARPEQETSPERRSWWRRIFGG